MKGLQINLKRVDLFSMSGLVITGLAINNQSLSLNILSTSLPEWGGWTYFVLAFLVAVEGPIVTLLGASAASAGLMRPGLVFFAAVMGNLTADLLWYSIGYMGKVEWFYRFGKRLGIRRDLLEKMKAAITEHAIKILFFAKLTVSFVIPSLMTAGLLRLPLKRWLPTFFFAETIWTGSLVLIGYYTTEAIQHVERGIEYVVLGGTILFVVVLLVVGRRFFKSLDLDND